MSTTMLALESAELAHILRSVDPNRCAADDGTPLEGFAVAPDLEVEYDPDDLAAGVDSVLEAAVNALLTN